MERHGAESSAIPHGEKHDTQIVHVLGLTASYVLLATRTPALHNLSIYLDSVVCHIGLGGPLVVVRAHGLAGTYMQRVDRARAVILAYRAYVIMRDASTPRIANATTANGQAIE